MAADPTLIIQMDFPVGKSLLESMPDELLTIVNKNLAPENAVKHLDARFRAAYKEGIKELLSLCLVSKRLEAVVRPVIFGKILICRSTELVLLLRTLTENRRMGEYIKNLVFATTFLGQDPDHELLNLDILRGLDFDLDLILPEKQARMTSRQENELQSNLCLMVLEKAPNVEKATMNPPSWSVRGLSNDQLATFGISSAVAHNRVATPQMPPSRLPKSLRTLTIEGPFEDRGLMEGLPQQFSVFWHKDLAHECNLKKLVWMYDDTTWFDSLPGSQWASRGLRGQLASLKTLHLIKTTCRFSDIAIVCDSFPSLKKLTIISDHAAYTLGDPKTDQMDGLTPDKTRLCLTRSITKLQCLEFLHLDLATVPNNTRLLGDNGGLDLSSLSGLKQANISFRLFKFNKVITGNGRKYDPSLFLPQSLEKLGIMVRGHKCEAGKDLKRFLKALHNACKYGFPRMMRVQCEYAIGIPGFQTVNPRCICVCASNPHEDFCTYRIDSGLRCSFLPWLPTRKFKVLKRKFGQRGIRLMKMTTTGYVVTGRTVTMVP